MVVNQVKHLRLLLRQASPASSSPSALPIKVKHLRLHHHHHHQHHQHQPLLTRTTHTFSANMGCCGSKESKESKKSKNKSSYSSIYPSRPNRPQIYSSFTASEAEPSRQRQQNELAKEKSPTFKRKGKTRQEQRSSSVLSDWVQWESPMRNSGGRCVVPKTAIPVQERQGAYVLRKTELPTIYYPNGDVVQSVGQPARKHMITGPVPDLALPIPQDLLPEGRSLVPMSGPPPKQPLCGHAPPASPAPAPKAQRRGPETWVRYITHPDEKRKTQHYATHPHPNPERGGRTYGWLGHSTGGLHPRHYITGPQKPALVLPPTPPLMSMHFCTGKSDESVSPVSIGPATNRPRGNWGSNFTEFGSLPSSPASSGSLERRAPSPPDWTAASPPYQTGTTTSRPKHVRKSKVQSYP